MVNYSSLKKSNSTPVNDFLNKVIGGPKGSGNGPFGLMPRQTTTKAASGANMGGGDGNTPSSGPEISGANSGQDMAVQLGLKKPTTQYIDTIPVPAADDSTAAPKTFAEYMADAAGLLGSGSTSTPDLSSYNTELSSVQGQGADADAKLAAMYQQLQGAYAAQQPDITAQYADTAAAQKANGTDATNAINQGYSAANANLVQTLQRLGIGDAAKVIAAHGTTLQGDQANHTANVAQNEAATLNHTAANGAAAGDYNREIGQAAALGGTEARATNQNNLQSRIASILAAKQQAAATAASSGPTSSEIASLAQQMYTDDQANDPTTVANQVKASTAATAAQKEAASESSTAASQKATRAKVYAQLLSANNNNVDSTNALMKQLGY